MPNYVKGRLRVEDFEKILKYNEVDLATKMCEIAKKAQLIAGKVLRGNKMALMDMRKLMNDNINLAFIMRDMIAIRQGNKEDNKALLTIIEREKKSIELEKRKQRVGRSKEYVKGIIERARIAQQIRKDELRKKIEKNKSGAFDSGDKEAPDQL